MAPLAGAASALLCVRAGSLVRAGFSLRAFYQCNAVVDGGLGAAAVQAFAGKAVQVHLGVGGDDHQVGGGDIRGGQRVLRADRTLGFHLDLVAQRGGGLAQSFGGHEGVGNAGGARGNADDAQFASGSGRGSRGGAEGGADHAGGVGQYGVQVGRMAGTAVQATGFGIAFGNDDDGVGRCQLRLVQTALHALRVAQFDADLMPGLLGGLA